MFSLHPFDRKHFPTHLAMMVVGILVVTNQILANQPTVLNGERPADRRLEPLRHLNSYFPFSPAENPEAWRDRAKQVRNRMLVSLGLWPLPTRLPLQPVIHGLIDRGDYTVESVYFESMPGFFVTGNLYRPKEISGKVPGVVCPHGHWPDGRFHAKSDDEMIRDVARGGETFFAGGRNPVQARCVGLARLGCIVLQYDMLGYAENDQLSFELVHRFAKQLEEMNTLENWGLFSTQAEAHCQSAMGLQAYNSMRALDFLCGLPEVDASRLGVTGASGGGTQTFILCGIDDRPAVAFPAVMVSTAMQGGCTCENASGLRVGTGNVEMAALFAPKPLLLSAADDWTVEMETKGFPELQAHYEMMGAPDNVMLVNRTEFKHNYNTVSRHAMYHWFNKHLGLGLPEPIEERDYLPFSVNELSVWNGDHPAPPDDVAFERKLLRWWHDDSQRQLQEMSPGPRRETVAAALDVILGRRLNEDRSLEFEELSQSKSDDMVLTTGLLHNRCEGEVLPMVRLQPANATNRCAIWLAEHGKAGLFADDGAVRPVVQRLLDANIAVYGIDMLYQGEFLGVDQPLVRARQVDARMSISTPRKTSIRRDAGAYTFGFNHSVFAQRVHDVLSLVGYLQSHREDGGRIYMAAFRGSGHWAAAALAQCGDAIDGAVIDTGGFRFRNSLDMFDPDFLPGGAKYGDLPGMLGMGAPTPLWLAGEDDESAEWAVTAYRDVDAGENLTLAPPGTVDVEAEGVSWILNCE